MRAHLEVLMEVQCTWVRVYFPLEPERLTTQREGTRSALTAVNHFHTYSCVDRGELSESNASGCTGAKMQGAAWSSLTVVDKEEVRCTWIREEGVR